MKYCIYFLFAITLYGCSDETKSDKKQDTETAKVEDCFSLFKPSEFDSLGLGCGYLSLYRYMNDFEILSIDTDSIHIKADSCYSFDLKEKSDYFQTNLLQYKSTDIQSYYCSDILIENADKPKILKAISGKVKLKLIKGKYERITAFVLIEDLKFEGNINIPKKMLWRIKVQGYLG